MFFVIAVASICRSVEKHELVLLYEILVLSLYSKTWTSSITGTFCRVCLGFNSSSACFRLFYYVLGYCSRIKQEIHVRRPDYLSPSIVPAVPRCCLSYNSVSTPIQKRNTGQARGKSRRWQKTKLRHNTELLAIYREQCSSPSCYVAVLMEWREVKQAHTLCTYYSPPG